VFASDFLQIPPHGGHPCHSLTVPTAKPVVDFHHQVITHAGRTPRKRPGQNPGLFPASKHNLRKRKTERSPCHYFANNARMAYSQPALVRSSCPGLNAFCPAFFFYLSFSDTAFVGKVIVKVVPSPGSLSTSIVPLWFSTKDWTTANPIPDSPNFVFFRETSTL